MTTEKTPEYWEGMAKFQGKALDLLPETMKRHVLRQASGFAGGRRRKKGSKADHAINRFDEKNTPGGKVQKDYYMGDGPKLSKDHEDVRYGDKSAVSAEFCGNCVYFMGDRTMAFGVCSLVAGGIKQEGRCDLWDEIVPLTEADVSERFTEDAAPRPGPVESAVMMSEDGETEVNLFVKFAKADEEEQKITGVVLVPDVVDSQQDFVAAADIEAAAHAFMQKSQTIMLQHRDKTHEVDVIESYIAPQDLIIGEETVTKGSWVMSVKVEDPEIWADVKEGKYTGFSIRGKARRTEA